MSTDQEIFLLNRIRAEVDDASGYAPIERRLRRPAERLSDDEFEDRAYNEGLDDALTEIREILAGGQV